MLEHRAPLDQIARARNTEPIDDPSLRVAAITDRRALLLQGRPDDPVLRDAVQRAFGVELPGPLAMSARAGTAILWLSPTEWLIELPASANDSGRIIAGALQATLAALTDMSDAFAGFDIDGARAVDVLMSGCSLELTSSAFATGRVARTAIADLPVVIRRLTGGESPAATHFRCWVDRSLAEHLWSWLAESPARG